MNELFEQSENKEWIIIRKYKRWLNENDFSEIAIGHILLFVGTSLSIILAGVVVLLLKVLFTGCK